MVIKKNLFKILIVDDEAEHRNILEMILTSNNYKTDTANSAKEALKKTQQGKLSFDSI